MGGVLVHFKVESRANSPHFFDFNISPSPLIFSVLQGLFGHIGPLTPSGIPILGPENLHLHSKPGTAVALFTVCPSFFNP